MKTRRDFLKATAATGVLGSIILPNVSIAATGDAAPSSGAEDRRYWISVLERLAAPVLENLAKGQLKNSMPVEAARPEDRRPYAHLEAFARLLVGMAPWLELKGLEGEERRLQRRWIELTHRALANATNPESPDFLNFERGGQALVDSAFLAQAVLRAPSVLWANLDSAVRNRLTAAIRSSRRIGTPNGSNWVMFAAMVEALMLKAGEKTIEERLETCVERMLSWYVGDGAYGDGERFHFDYYNAFVIQPMLVDVLRELKAHDAAFAPVFEIVLKRSRRFAVVQERLIAPDGTFPPLGRSITYRFGAFQTLAQMALMRQLDEPIVPAQVRCAMTAMIRRLIEVQGTFDAEGWLRPGLCGHQPALAEHYISTGSLYLCSVGLLPLGLPAGDPFWSAPAVPWTSQRLWAGESLPADKAMSESAEPVLPRLKRT